MRLVHFQGLHCYHDCLVTLADTFGLDYLDAFAYLWAEGELRYDPICEVFLTQTMPKALETVGLRLEPPQVTKEAREIGWSGIPFEGFAILGMDAYMIPWNPLYQLQHGPHYFIVQKGASDLQVCSDPTYGVDGQKMAAKELLSNSYALIPVQITDAYTAMEHKDDPLFAQAREVLDAHPVTMQGFSRQAADWIQSDGGTALLPAKYVDALLTGRYLYQRFLMERYPAPERAYLFQRNQYFDDWKAVKNGLYKAALIKRNRTVFDESCSRLHDLFEQEMALAKEILTLGR